MSKFLFREYWHPSPAHAMTLCLTSTSTCLRYIASALKPVDRCNGRNRRIYALAALVLLSIASAIPASASDASANAMTAQMEVNRLRYGIAGQAVYVAQGPHVIHRGVEGAADTQTGNAVTLDHAFPVYSLSKLFASTLVMQLAEQGDVDLDASVGTYVAGLPQPWQGITVRQLLNHTSGLPEYFSNAQYRDATGNTVYPPDAAALFASLADAPLAFVPGSETRYTQTNYIVLSELLSTHYGTPYRVIVQERILQPLQMQHTWLGATADSQVPSVTSYIGKDGTLREDPELILPPYAYAHGSAHTTLDDLARFLQAMAAGELVGKQALSGFWRDPLLVNGRRGVFATGWDYGVRGGVAYVGHDGGTKVRVRIVPGKTPDDAPYLVAYLTNGSAHNVWSSVLVDSALAAVAPEQFPVEHLQEDLIGYATMPADAVDPHGLVRSIRMTSTLADRTLENTINATGYLLLQNLGGEAALRVFILNTLMFPASANVWDSLGEAYAGQGETAKADAAYAKARTIARPEPE